MRLGLTVIYLLSLKCQKSLYRDRSIVWLACISTIAVLGGLYCMWYISKNEKLRFLTSRPYSTLSFDIYCIPGKKRDSKASVVEHLSNFERVVDVDETLDCSPLNIKDPNSGELSPAYVLMKALGDGGLLYSSSTAKEINQFVDMLSSIMMNGIPLVGIDDFVFLSDFINKKLGVEGRKRLLESPVYREKFSNFLDVRNKRLLLSPNTVMVRNFVEYLMNTTSIASVLNYQVLDSNEAISQCCENIWAIVDITEPQNDDPNIDSPSLPSVTIRMHPSAIPDTRNFAWSPMRRAPPRQQSGELLYFLSGFLSLQLEVQNFFSFRSEEGVPLPSKVLKGQGDFLMSPFDRASAVVRGLVEATTSELVYESILNTTSQSASSMYFPLYHRAFPTHVYLQGVYWHVFGTLITIAITVYFSLPAAITCSAFRREISGGHIDVLSTLPGVSEYHSVLSWCVSCLIWVTLSTACAFIFFSNVLAQSNASVPVLACFLYGVALGPMSICVGKIIRNADAVVVAIPLLVFILMLPGLLYFELAFDVQKSMALELLMCLFPSCAVALVLRLVCAAEAMDLGISWSYESAVSNTPVFAYLLILLFDIFLYSGIAFILSKPALKRDQSENNAGSGKSALEIRQLSKEYSAKGKNVSVLSDINCVLEYDSVTLLLGSNGAGKTTLMKILSGLDPSFSGTLRFLNSGAYSTEETRFIGWCPQTEALFPFLTVLEHMELFQRLYKKTIFDKDSFGWQKCLAALYCANIGVPVTVQCCMDSLSKLNMLEHMNKRVTELSGGMKRRLSLSLAFIGDPKVILLDEPTSGCDAWTRELVRKDILSRKHGAAVLVSTHHVDDIDVLADQVWFLNDRFLAFSGNLVDLRKINKLSISAEAGAQYSHRATPLVSSGIVKDAEDSSADTNDDFEFATWDDEVLQEFNIAFTDVNVQYSESVSTFEQGFVRSWRIPARDVQSLMEFVRCLEIRSKKNWSLSSVQVFKALCKMYDSKDQDCGKSEPLRNTLVSSHVSPIPVSLQYFRPIFDFFRHIGAIVHIRYVDQKKKIRNFFFLQLFLPFVVVLLLVVGCRDVSYPKVELTSKNINGVGEVCLARNSGKPDDSPSTIGIVTDPQRFLFSDEKELSAKRRTFTSKRLLNFAANESFADFFYGRMFSTSEYISWKGDMNSDSLWTHLYEEYDNHVDHRWGAFVMDDTVPHWMETTIVISELSLSLDIETVYSQIQRAAAVICNRKKKKKHEQLTDATVKLHGKHVKTTICPPYPSTTISIYNGTFPDVNMSFEREKTVFDLSSKYSIIISSFQSLSTNLTLLSNVTTDHAAPIFLREVFPLMYDYSLTNSFESVKNVSKIIPQYTLFSHPFFQANLVNFIFMQRGYLGSTIILFYMLLTTIVSVRFITKARDSGIKRQLHLAGVHPSAYWIGNYLSDVALVLSALVSIYAAINIGGEPIRSYFFQFDPIAGSVFILCVVHLSFAVVSSSYSLCVLSSNQLSSQLFMLVSTVSCGVFLKLYLDRYDYFPFTSVSAIFLWISPAFTFSTAMFFIFQKYEMKVSAIAVESTAAEDFTDDILKVYGYSSILLLQAVLYLLLAITIDIYWTRFVAFLLSFRWYFSIHDGCIRCATSNSVSSTPSSSFLPSRLSQPSLDAENTALLHSCKNSSYCGEGYADNVSIADSAEHIPALLSMCGDVGVFPIIDSKRYRAMLFNQPVGLRGDGRDVKTTTPMDIEMTTLRNISNKDTKDTTPLLESEHLAVEYANSGYLSLCDLSFSFEGSDRVALMGMNGGGKSTLFKTLALSECVPISGFASVAGYRTVKNMWELGPNNAIGYVPQEGGFLNALTARECIELYSVLRGVPVEDAYQSGLLPERYLDFPISALSGGTKKKLALLAANIGNPRLLLLDECTTGVDPLAAAKIVEFLKHQLQPHQGLLFASHRIDETISVCNKVLLLFRGQKYIDGDIRSFNEVAFKFYQVDVAVAASTAARVSGTTLIPTASDSTDCIHELLSGMGNIERVVLYSDRLVRLTLEKEVVSLYSLWVRLEQLKRNRFIDSYAFRLMDTEEVLSTILSTKDVN